MNSYKSIVVLTGAGISVESGIPTFRAQDGLWEEHRIEDVATPEAFEKNPVLVHQFYNMRRQPLLENQVHANPAHHALAKLEREFSGSFMLITQNIDNLHEQGGSKHVWHMHGEILKMRCRQTAQLFDCKTPAKVSDLCLCCDRPGNLRPHIVWFGEMPFYMDEISSALSSCDLFVAIGTSGNVYPAAGFVQLANQAGADTIEINLQESNVATEFDVVLCGKASEILPVWVDDLLS